MSNAQGPDEFDVLGSLHLTETMDNKGLCYHSPRTSPR